MIKKIILYAFVSSLVFASCKQVVETQTTIPYQFTGDTVRIFDQRLLHEKVKLNTVTQELVAREVSTAGIIQAIPTQYAYIAPPFAGRVVQSHIKLGEQVEKNTPLFEIISSDFTTAQKDFFQADSDCALARIQLQRQQDLVANGVGSQKELEEATNALFLADKEYENAYTALQVFQTDPKQMKLGQPLIVRAPIAGEVIKNKLVTGQYLTNESDHVAVVADLSKVWVVAQVKEKDIRYIQVGDQMDIQIAALPDEPLKGKVYYMDGSIDLDTRSVQVLSVCDNSEGHLKLGMYATVHFTDQPRPHLVVPEKAILQGEESSYVLVQKGDASFVRTAVEVVVTRDGKAVLKSGLNVGDVVISEGGYYLK